MQIFRARQSDWKQIFRKNLGCEQFLKYLIVFLLWMPSIAWSGVYEAPIIQGASWLVSQQNSDGSWGTGTIQHLYTSEAVTAMAVSYRENGAHLKGINWLWNHFPKSTDFKARRVAVLAQNGSDAEFSSSIVNAQAIDGGWGVSSAYRGSPLDTALALQGLWALNDTTGVDEGLDYLTSSQIGAPQIAGSANGWPLLPGTGDTTMDPLNTALVLRAMVPFEAAYPDINLSIASAIAYLTTTVSTAFPDLVKAHTAYALLTKDANSTKGLELLDSFTQAGDGSWSQNIYLTALNIQSMALVEAVGQTNNPETLAQLADPALHAFIAAELLKNRSDAIRYGDLTQLTSLDLQGTGITSLAGLEGAINLASLDLDVDLNTYVGSGGGLRYAGILEDLSGLTNENLTVTVNANGTLPFRGAMIKLPATPPTQDVPPGSAHIVSWGQEVYDTDNFWDPANPEYFLIPAGVSNVRITSNVVWEGTDQTGTRWLWMTKNGQSDFDGNPLSSMNATDPGFTGQNFTSGVIPVVENDQFRLEINHLAGADLNITDNESTWFAIEIIE